MSQSDISPRNIPAAVRIPTSMDDIAALIRKYDFRYLGTTSKGTYVAVNISSKGGWILYLVTDA